MGEDSFETNKQGKMVRASEDEATRVREAVGDGELTRAAAAISAARLSVARGIGEVPQARACARNIGPSRQQS
jgi:hypothetical protein